MNTLTFALIVAAGAAALHVFIFVLETLMWQSLLARKTFGMTEEKATTTKEMAANQGVYNLLLAVEVLAGIIAVVVGQSTIGLALIVAGCGSMLIAATYLASTSPDKRMAALKQGALPFIALLLVAFVFM